MIARIKLCSRETIISSSDLEKVSKYRWYYSGNNAAYTYLDGECVYLHRFILDVYDDPQVEIDHINGDRLDNRRENLRICDHKQNLRNQKKRGGTLSKFKGAYWAKSKKKWYSKICVDYKMIHLGYFKSEYEAALAYNSAASHYFGEFARLNEVPLND